MTERAVMCGGELKLPFRKGLTESSGVILGRRLHCVEQQLGERGTQSWYRRDDTLFASVPPKSNLPRRPRRLADPITSAVWVPIWSYRKSNRRAGPGAANPSVRSQYQLNGLTAVAHFNMLK
jgi:hypothetical protein